MPSFESLWRQNLLASGAVGAQQQRRREAEESYRAAIRARPDYAHAYNNLGNVLRDGGTDGALRQAGRAYALAVQLSPRYLEAYRNLGNLLKEREPWRWAAVRAYRVALDIDPTGRAVLLNLGDVLQWLGRTQAANVTHALAVERGVWQHPQQRPSHFVSGLHAAAWWPTASHPLLARLLAPAAIEVLLKEGERLLAHRSARMHPATPSPTARQPARPPQPALTTLPYASRSRVRSRRRGHLPAVPVARTREW